MVDVLSMLSGSRLSEAERQRALAVHKVLAEWPDVPTGVVIHPVTKLQMGFNFEIDLPRPTASLRLSVIAGMMAHEYAEISPLNANGPVYTNTDAETNDDTPYKVKVVATPEALRAEIVRLASMARQGLI